MTGLRHLNFGLSDEQFQMLTEVVSESPVVYGVSCCRSGRGLAGVAGSVRLWHWHDAWRPVLHRDGSGTHGVLTAYPTLFDCSAPRRSTGTAAATSSTTSSCAASKRGRSRRGGPAVAHVSGMQGARWAQPHRPAQRGVHRQNACTHANPTQEAQAARVPRRCARASALAALRWHLQRIGGTDLCLVLT